MEIATNPLFLGLLSIIILIFSAIFHEIAHGYVAEQLGDPTARLMGRLTLDPRKHIDPFMSILLPLMLILSGSPVIFGGAKPVPIDPFNLKEGRKDIALVSLSGPLTNVIIAIIAAVLFRVLFPHPLMEITNPAVYLFGYILLTIARINVLLAIFNLIPIPPLDGSKVFALILPEEMAAVYLGLSSVGMLLLFFLLFFPIGSFSLQTLISDVYGFSLSLLGLP